MSENNLKLSFEEEIKNLENDDTLTSKFLWRKLIGYCLRTTISITVLFYLKDREWIHWAILIYAPINLIGLASIFGARYYTQRKLNQLKERVQHL